jgi:hypothetical protein
MLIKENKGEMNMKNAEIVIEGESIREITDILYEIEDEAQLGQHN